jgi:ribosomal subunit interface protein
MRLQMSARHPSVNDTVRAYAEKRFAKLDRRLPAEALVEVTFSRETNPAIPDDHVVEAVVHLKGARPVAKEAALTYEAAIDRVLDKLERQVERLRDKRVQEPRRRAGGPPHESIPVEVLDQAVRSTPGEQGT